MRRREFITLVGGTAATWPFAAHAQRSREVKRVGILLFLADNDPSGQASLAIFKRRLQQLGWNEGDNVRFDYVAADSFLSSHAGQIAKLGLPTSFAFRAQVAAGGLMSYGASITDTMRQVGRYVGRVLRGEKPGDLPVLQPTRYELVLNLKTAKALGLTIPPSMLLLADEVIE